MCSAPSILTCSKLIAKIGLHSSHSVANPHRRKAWDLGPLSAPPPRAHASLAAVGEHLILYGGKAQVAVDQNPTIIAAAHALCIYSIIDNRWVLQERVASVGIRSSHRWRIPHSRFLIWTSSTLQCPHLCAYAREQSCPAYDSTALALCDAEEGNMVQHRVRSMSCQASVFLQSLSRQRCADIHMSIERAGSWPLVTRWWLLEEACQMALTQKQYIASKSAPMQLRLQNGHS